MVFGNSAFAETAFAENIGVPDHTVAITGVNAIFLTGTVSPTINLTFNVIGVGYTANTGTLTLSGNAVVNVTGQSSFFNSALEYNATRILQKKPVFLDN